MNICQPLTTFVNNRKGLVDIHGTGRLHILMYGAAGDVFHNNIIHPAVTDHIINGYDILMSIFAGNFGLMMKVGDHLIDFLGGQLIDLG